MTTIKVVRAIINLGSIQLDVFQLPDGEYRLSQVQILEIIDLPKNWISRLEKKAPNILKSLKNMGFTGKIELVSVDKTRAKVMSLEDAKVIWAYCASQGNMKALGLASETSTDKLIYRRKKKKLSIKGQEKRIQKRMWQELGGEIEVPTLAGNIDLLTALELIEIKEVKSWKCAIGQIICYGRYYPSHKKRIHLFGECQESYINFVQSHCNPLAIVVTWER